MTATRSAGNASELDQLLDGYAGNGKTQAAGRVRQKKLPQWTGYAAAAGASMAMASAADGAIQHIVPPSPIRLELANNLNSYTFRSTTVDFDNDGNSDMYFTIGATSSPGYYHLQAAIAQSVYGNGAMLATTGMLPLVRRLASGASISASLPQSVFGVFRAQSTTYGYAYTYGEFPANGTGIAGVQFPIGGQNHFGWVRIALESNVNGLRAMEIREWAYEDVPDTAIRAGQVPEPSSAGLAALATGAAGVATLRRRRRAK